MLQCKDCGKALPERAACPRCAGYRCEECCDKASPRYGVWWVLVKRPGHAMSGATFFQIAL